MVSLPWRLVLLVFSLSDALRPEEPGPEENEDFGLLPDGKVCKLREDSGQGCLSIDAFKKSNPKFADWDPCECTHSCQRRQYMGNGLPVCFTHAIAIGRYCELKLNAVSSGLQVKVVRTPPWLTQFRQKQEKARAKMASGSWRSWFSGAVAYGKAALKAARSRWTTSQFLPPEVSQASLEKMRSSITLNDQIAGGVRLCYAQEKHDRWKGTSPANLATTLTACHGRYFLLLSGNNGALEECKRNPIPTLTCLMSESSRGGNGATSPVVMHGGTKKPWGDLMTPHCLQFLETNKVSLPPDYHLSQVQIPQEDERTQKILADVAARLQPSGSLLQRGLSPSPDDDEDDGDSMSPEELEAFREEVRNRDSDASRQAKYRYAAKCIQEYHDKCDEHSGSFRTRDGEVGADGGRRTRQTEEAVVAHALHAYAYWEKECLSRSRCDAEVLDVDFKADEDDEDGLSEEDAAALLSKADELESAAIEREEGAEQSAKDAEEIEDEIDNSVNAFN